MSTNSVYVTVLTIIFNNAPISGLQILGLLFGLSGSSTIAVGENVVKKCSKNKNTCDLKKVADGDLKEGKEVEVELHENI